ncbi:MAG TPA: 3-dehydroquinate synthase family protein [Sphaerochaeta sp.]|nr:3-dehydroquinate synthase family protein [Sphaerochaeta sp.]
MRTLLTARLANNIESTVLLADGLKDLSTHLGSYGRSVLWIFDTNTAKLFKQLPPSHVVLESGESQKNFASLERIISTALEEGLARDGRIIGFGGGVVCDLAGFAASVYMRGCTLTLVPTTLLAMVDASLGGKTAIDYRGVKNIVGSFYPAREVLISTDVLHTLNEREYLNGLGEVLKHALLSSDDRLYRFVVTQKNEILSRDAKILDLMVELSLRVKLEYIEQDPTEQLGIRQMLNLGHTFGHALESTFHFGTFSHGSAVAWGCCRALEAGVSLGITDRSWADGALKLFRSYGYDVEYRIGRGDWISYREHLMKDKKRLDGKLLFVLLEGQGSGVLKTLDTALIQQLVIAKPTF